MVKGIERFKEYFTAYEGNYVIIGGTACEIHEEENALIPRATKDIDIILIVEALSTDFVSRFWEFVKAAGYEEKNKGERTKEGYKHEYYRFMKPQNSDFPFQIELFSRNIGLLNCPAEAHITPIPIDEDLSSLSAILMDDDYYHFTIEHSRTENGIHIANIESLICLKCRAFLEMTKRKKDGESVDRKQIAKHKKDVFRLAGMLAPANKYDIPNTLRMDIENFCNAVESDLPNKDFLSASGFKNITGNELLFQLKQTFLLE